MQDRDRDAGLPLTSMDLTIWSNIPNPYNHYLYRSLRSLGVDLDVFYASEPQSRGRPWAIPRDPYETIAGTIRSEFRTLPDAARETTALISGGYLGKAETIRRLFIPRHVERVWYWGERLKSREALAPYRRWYFKPFAGIFAIGSWARPSYESLARPGQTVHTLPYTTNVRQTTRKPSETPLIGFAGSLIERKGVDILLRGLAEMPRHRRPRLEVVGSGPLRPQLEQIGVDHRLDVDWLGELDQRPWTSTGPHGGPKLCPPATTDGVSSSPRPWPPACRQSCHATSAQATIWFVTGSMGLLSRRLRLVRRARSLL